MLKFIFSVWVAFVLLEIAVASKIKTGASHHLPITRFDSTKFRYMGSHRVAPEKGIAVKSVMSSSTSHYFLSSSNADWHAAESDCKVFLGEEATLVFFETQDEIEALEGFIDEMDITISSFWIGGEYNAEMGEFQWGNGIAFDSFIPWDSGYPDTFSEVTKVAAFHSNGVRLRTEYQTVPNRYACELNFTESTQEIKPCLKRNDVVILVDASYSIPKDQYKIALNFCKNFTEGWLSVRDSRVSVGIFDSSVNILFTLADSKVFDEVEISSRISSAKHTRGKTFTHTALEEGMGQFEDNGALQNIILLTDGISDYPMETIDAATRALSSGIRIFSVAIGDQVDEMELLAFTGNIPKRVFSSGNNTSNLEQFLGPVSVELCAA